jgi:hypothetical protein
VRVTACSLDLDPVVGYYLAHLAQDANDVHGGAPSQGYQNEVDRTGPKRSSPVVRAGVQVEGVARDVGLEGRSSMSLTSPRESSIPWPMAVITSL